MKDELKTNYYKVRKKHVAIMLKLEDREEIEIVYDRNSGDLERALERGIENLSQISKDKYVIVDLHQSLALKREVLDRLYVAHPNVIINVFYDENDKSGYLDYRGITLNGQKIKNSGINTFTYSREETKKFVENYNYIREKYYGEMVINYDFTVSMAVDATNKINSWAEQIMSAKVDGRPLTPFEKFLMAYQIASQYAPYKQHPEDNGKSRKSRDLVSVLHGDYIVCAGYAKLLNELCNKVGLNCSCQMLHRHEVCSFDMQDEVYGIDGRFISDPTSQPYIRKNHYEDINLGKAIMTYDFAEKMYETKAEGIRNSRIFQYSAQEILGIPFEEYKDLRLKELFEKFDDAITDRQKFYDINTLPMFLRNYFSGEYDVEFCLQKLNNLCFKNKEELKKAIIKTSKDIQFSIIDYSERARKYAQERENKAVKPLPEKFLSAYNNVLIALGIVGQNEREKIIEGALDFSLCEAFLGSDFYGCHKDSKMHKAFYEMFEEVEKDI